VGLRLLLGFNQSNKMFYDYDLKLLKKKHPLPAGVNDFVCNMADLAIALDKSENTIAKYHKGGMPVLTQGGSGKSYEFQLADCWAWYHGFKDSEQVTKDSKQYQLELLRTELVGEDGSDNMLALSPKQRSEEYEAARRYAETALVQSKLVRKSEVSMLLEGIFNVVRHNLLGLPDIMERRVGLSAIQAEAMEKISKEMISSIANTLKESNLAVVIENKIKSNARSKK